MNQRAFTTLPRLLATVMVAVYSSAALAQSTNEQQARKEAAGKMINEESAAYKIAVAAEPAEKLSLHAAPVKSWTNEVNGEVYGIVFIWKLDGRPEVVGSLYRSYSPYNYFAAELQSVSERELLATRSEEVVWQPSAGVTFQPVPLARPPSETRTNRLLQMRSIARRFAGELTDGEKVRRPLQILPKPLYRYDKTPPKLLDGALFSLVSGTDPEVLLLIEARQAAGEFQWRYALARLSVMELRVTYDGQTVWSVALVQKPYARLSEPYTIIQRDFDAAE